MSFLRSYLATSSLEQDDQAIIERRKSIGVAQIRD
jgi:hypothetical protein